MWTTIGEVPNTVHFITFLFEVKSNGCWYAFDSSYCDLSVQCLQIFSISYRFEDITDQISEILRNFFLKFKILNTVPWLIWHLDIDILRRPWKFQQERLRNGGDI